MNTVRQLLQIKSNQIWSVNPKTTVYEALELMAVKNIGSVLVLEAEKIVGIFTERDYARKVILHGKSSRTSTVGELMTTEVLYIDPDDTVENCMALMTNKRARHLPVMEKGKLVGVI